MKRIFQFLTLTLLFFSLLGCTNLNQSAVPQSTTSVNILSIQNTSTPTASFSTPRPTLTATITPTLVQIPHSTFDANKAIIQTQLPPAQCPKSAQGVSFPDLDTLNQSQEGFEKTTLEILNSGGINTVVSKLSESNLYTIDRGDLTHDNVSELIIENRYIFPSGFLSVFGCKDGRYEKLLTVNAVYEYAPRLFKIMDMNLNGMPELVVTETTCHYCLGAQIFEWDGLEFQSLAREWFIDPSLNAIDYSTIVGLDGLADVKISDIDGNKTYELIFQGGFPSNIGDAYMVGPYRSREIVYMWNGQYYSQYSSQYAPAEYRFQAIQDGDDASLRGAYEDALTAYQDAIFSDKLRGWSEEERQNLIAQGEVIYSASPSPTPLPMHNEDYFQLAAYARYRIMLLHLLKGFHTEAQTVYTTLQEKFPTGNPGYPYVEMATAFWKEFQNTQNIKLACQKAIIYADAHPEILIPLGGPEYSFWSKSYLAADVCPFKE